MCAAAGALQRWSKLNYMSLEQCNAVEALLRAMQLRQTWDFLRDKLAEQPMWVRAADLASETSHHDPHVFNSHEEALQPLSVEQQPTGSRWKRPGAGHKRRS